MRGKAFAWGVGAALALQTAWVAPVRAAPAPVPLDYLPALSGDYFPLKSKAADHLYHIYVRLPENYHSEPKRRYPIVYLLDGDSLFPILAANHLFLTYDDKIPEAIVVGIAYGSFAKPTNRRHIDCVPPARGVRAEESGTVAFQRFLKSELIPAVERRYRTDPERRILYGQARCGAMVLYSAFTDPDLFWARIASNPSIDPGREIFFGQPARAKQTDLRLVVTSGTEDRPRTRQAALEWLKFWDRRSDVPWSLKGIDIRGGTHAANSTDAYRSGMRWLFPTDATGGN